MANIPDDVFFATAGELNARLKAKEFSAVELTRAFCDRLEKHGARFNALALTLREPAMRKAKDVDNDLKRERFRGRLQGVPFGVKDLLSVAGHPTTWGAKPYAGQAFDYDANVVRRLNNAGAILVGKLAMIELAGGGGYRYAAASLTGPGLNPWDRTRWSGGSSSGSGSAVAAGLVIFALGSETNGSIVTPSAFCGVTGLRPTYGLVSRHGAMALSWTMDKIGPMCRSAEDCGLVLEAIAGKDPADPSSAGKAFYYAPQFARKFTELRLGYAAVDFDERPDPPAREAFRQALEAIRGFGFQTKEVALPDLPYSAMTRTIISAEGSAVFEELIASGRVDELADARQIAGLKAGLEIPAKDYLRAMRVRSQVQEAFRRLFVDVDVLIVPARSGPASRIGDRLDASPPGDSQPKSAGLSDLVSAGNLAGLPALVLPCGFADGMPVAVLLVGRPFTENTLLATGKQYQSVTDWHRRRPKVP